MASVCREKTRVVVGWMRGVFVPARTMGCPLTKKILSEGKFKNNPWFSQVDLPFLMMSLCRFIVFHLFLWWNAKELRYKRMKITESSLNSFVKCCVSATQKLCQRWAKSRERMFLHRRPKNDAKKCFPFVFARTRARPTQSFWYFAVTSVTRLCVILWLTVDYSDFYIYFKVLLFLLGWFASFGRKSNVLFWWKWRVVLLKTTCCFIENDVLFWWKRRVVCE